MPVAAFFDLDGCLAQANSGRLWFRRERREGRLAPHQVVEAAVWLGLYRFGLMNGRTALSRAVRSMEGDPEELVIERTRRMYEEDIAPSFAPGGLATVEAHRALGHKLVLLTSSSNYLGNCVQDALGLDEALTMRFGIRDGRFTGEIDRLCFGPAKVEVARSWAEEQGIDLASCSFYTDSITDLPMLEAVGEPRVVNPDPRLSRLAGKRGWTVLDWTENPDDLPTDASADAAATPIPPPPPATGGSERPASSLTGQI